MFPMRGLTAGSNLIANGVGEGGEADTILLADDEIREGRGETLGVFELRERRVRPAIAHAFADVENQLANEVGLFLELLEIELVGSRVDLPIEIAEVVAGCVFAMLGELDRE